MQIPDYPLTWNPCIWKLGSKICREPRQKVLGTPPPVELHCKKGSLRLTELRPWRHLCSGITILGKRIQHRAWKTTKQFGKNSSHVLAHLLVVREGLGVLLVFPRVSYGFLTANSNICHGIFDKRKFFWDTLYQNNIKVSESLSHYENVNKEIVFVFFCEIIFIILTCTHTHDRNLCS